MPEIEFDVAQGRDESFPAFATRFYTALKATGRFYRSAARNPIFIESGGGTEIVTASEMAPKVLSVLSPYQEVQTRAGSSYKEYGTVPSHVFSQLFNHAALGVLDELDTVVTSPVLFRRAGAWAVSAPGFNRGDNVCFYQTGGAIAPRTTTDHLRACFTTLPFDSPGYMANAMAYLLSLLVLDREMLPPILVVDGNDRGVGKTSLVESFGTIAQGDRGVRNVTARGAELTKQIGAGLINKERFMLLDNVQRQSARGFDHAEFSQLTTGNFSKSIRILGQNKFVSGCGLYFAMTLNEAKLSEDIASRALNVFLNVDKFQLAPVACGEYAAVNRDAIYGELLNIGLSSAGFYTAPPSRFRFRPWAHFVLPRIEPVFGPLLLEPPRPVDEIGVELSSFLSEVTEPFAASRLVSSVIGRPEHYSSISERLSSGNGSTRSQQIIAGRLLTRFCGKVFEVDGVRKILRFSQGAELYAMEDA